jgi:4'-phosphopantetheinyl transferase
VTVAVRVTWMLSGDPAEADRLLTHEVARFHGLSVAEVDVARSCATCGSGDHGRPVVDTAARTFLSLARAQGVLLVAVSDDAPVGVDVERADAGGFPGFADVALHPLEDANTAEECATAWVRKEALLKATGHGLQVDPRTIRISDEDQPRLLVWPTEPVPDVQFLDLEIDGYAACLAVLDGQMPSVTVRQAAPAAPAR